jgi:hypothetical protein
MRSDIYTDMAYRSAVRNSMLFNIEYLAVLLSYCSSLVGRGMVLWIGQWRMGCVNWKYFNRKMSSSDYLGRFALRMCCMATIYDNLTSLCKTSLEYDSSSRIGEADLDACMRSRLSLFIYQLIMRSWRLEMQWDGRCWYRCGRQPST